MIHVDLRPDLDATPWLDLHDQALEGEVAHGILEGIGGLPDGTESGKTAVVLRAKLDSGETVLIETTLALYATAFFGLRGRYADELAEYPPT